jgi:6-phosphogluconolactonase/glucosamine-6-phosphate isomerase/deaminase
MNFQLLGRIDIPKSAIHFIDDALSRTAIPSFCESYDRLISDAGGIDLLILGIGNHRQKNSRALILGFGAILKAKRIVVIEWGNWRVQ